MDTHCISIPTRLTVAHRPELAVFPLDVFFLTKSEEPLKSRIRTALYVPDLSSYKLRPLHPMGGGDLYRMWYYNRLGRDWRLEITYMAENRQYIAWKWHGDRVELWGKGKTWQEFFMSVTARGLAEGESCITYSVS